ncbi:MAG: hypothetical protein ACOVQI_00750, partial [Tagaea sp.]
MTQLLLRENGRARENEEGGGGEKRSGHDGTDINLVPASGATRLTGRSRSAVLAQKTAQGLEKLGVRGDDIAGFQRFGGLAA